jgi:hypothetical protein
MDVDPSTNGAEPGRPPRWTPSGWFVSALAPGRRTQPEAKIELFQHRRHRARRPPRTSGPDTTSLAAIAEEETHGAEVQPRP